MTDLTDLLAALESGTAGDLPYETWLSACGMPDDVDNAKMADQGDTQAAIDFLKVQLPGERFTLFGPIADGTYGAHLGDIDTVFASDPARAMLIATFKALVAKEAGDE